jgi:hypothetical protein
MRPLLWRPAVVALVALLLLCGGAGPDTAAAWTPSLRASARWRLRYVTAKDGHSLAVHSLNLSRLGPYAFEWKPFRARPFTKTGELMWHAPLSTCRAAASAPPTTPTAPKKAVVAQQVGSTPPDFACAAFAEDSSCHDRRSAWGEACWLHAPLWP